jgi:hypothetical protein
VHNEESGSEFAESGGGTGGEFSGGNKPGDIRVEIRHKGQAESELGTCFIPRGGCFATGNAGAVIRKYLSAMLLGPVSPGLNQSPAAPCGTKKKRHPLPGDALEAGECIPD